MSKLLKNIIETYPEEEFLVATGFDDALIGVEVESGRLVYSVPKCIDILMHEHKMDDETAIDFFHYNVSGSFVGDKTPIWVNDKF